MSQEPSRRAGRTPRFRWPEPPEGEADENGAGVKGKPDPQLIIAGLALAVALVLVILAF